MYYMVMAQVRKTRYTFIHIMSVHINFTQVAFHLIQSLGYGGLFAGLVIDSLGIPIPSEILVPVSTILAGQGRFSLVGVLLVSVLAQTIGGLIGYCIGRYAGEPFLAHYGKYVLISKADISRSHAAFRRYGTIITLIGRCLPVIRGFISYPAGIAEMPLVKYLVFTAIGSAIWTGVLMVAGEELRRHIELIDHYSQQLSYVVIGLVVLAVGWHIYHVFRDHRHAV